VKHRGLRFGQPEQLAGIGGLRLGQLHLAQDGADDQDFGIAADLFADVLPAPALLALDVEQLFSEVGSFHVSLPFKSVMSGLVPAMILVLIPDAVHQTPMRSPVRIYRSAPPERCEDRG